MSHKRGYARLATRYGDIRVCLARSPRLSLRLCGLPAAAGLNTAAAEFRIKATLSSREFDLQSGNNTADFTVNTAGAFLSPRKKQKSFP
jgi:hypothetical protein